MRSDPTVIAQSIRCVALEKSAQQRGEERRLSTRQCARRTRHGASWRAQLQHGVASELAKGGRGLHVAMYLTAVDRE